MTRQIFLFTVFSQLALGCAQLEGSDGGAANLPTRGATGYEPIARGNPPSSLVISPDTSSALSYRQPHAMHDGDGVTLVFEAHDNATGHSWIARAHAADGISFDEPVPLLGGPDDSTAFSSPTVACSSQDCILLAASSDQQRLYVARGSLAGSFTLDEHVPFEVSEDYETAGITHPSAAYDPKRDLFVIVYQTHGAPETTPDLALATLSATGEISKRGLVPLTSQPCISAANEPEPCWDTDGRTSPDLRRAITASDRVLWRLSYTGSSSEDSAVGFAASWDAENFVAFESNPGFSGQRAEPSNIRLGAHYLLYFVSASPWGPAGISLAQSTEGFPGDSF
jgi:hypothetical protein